MTKEWLVYTEEDLVALTNRGTVKRALREFQEDGLTPRFVHAPQSIEVHWSDAVSCVFIATRPLSEAYCSCPAGHLCRHVVRSIFAIQKAFAQDLSEEVEGPWNPGEIDDSKLLTIFSADAVDAAQQKIQDGIVCELHSGTRPFARLLTDAQTVQFRLQTDLSSATCTCAKTTLCDHVLLAVLAFRLKGDDGVTLITTQNESSLNPDLQELLQRVEDVLFAQVRMGLARIDSTSLDRLQSLANALYDADLVHSAEVLEDFFSEINLYTAHDARFSVSALAALLGEFAIRHDALKASEIPIPRFFVRGQAVEQDLQIGQGRLTGLGCLCDVSESGVTMRAVLFDTMAARILQIPHFFANTDDPPDFSDLGRRLVFAGRSLETFARGQIIARHTQISRSHRLNLGQQNMSVYAQNLAWEELPPSVFYSDFGALIQRLQTEPPRALQRRVIGEDFVVLAVNRVDNVRFDDPQQAVCARLWDNSDTAIDLTHPYFSRGRAGAEHLLNVLLSSAYTVRFVAGRIHSTLASLEIQPAALVVEDQDGRRQLLVPFLDHLNAQNTLHVEIDSGVPSSNAVDSIRKDLLEALGEVLMLGPSQALNTIDFDQLEARLREVSLHLPAQALDAYRQALRADPNHADQALWHALVIATLVAQI